MVSQKSSRLSPAIRAYLEAGQYIVTAASPEANDWHVIKTDGTAYLVDLGAGTCTCPDFQHRGQERPCKHIELVKLHVAADAPAPEFPATAAVTGEDPFAPEDDEPRPSVEEEIRLGLQDEERYARFYRERDLLWG